MEKHSEKVSQSQTEKQ